MSPEYFSDALNYLDDDLIEQTDALRQGRRVLHRPKVIRWVVPAACLVLVLGALAVPAVNGGIKGMEGGNTEMAPGFLAQDSANSIHAPENGCDCSETIEVQQVSSGDISLYIPEDWEYSMETIEEGSRYIVIRHPNYGGTIRVGYSPLFGVCGTGLSSKEAVIAGMRATVNTYDSSPVWDFIAFPDAPHWYVVINEGADAWLDEAMTYLETIEIQGVE